MVKRSFIFSLFLLASSSALACNPAQGTGQCGFQGADGIYGSALDAQESYNRQQGGGGYYDPSRIPLPPIVITLPDKFGSIAENNTPQLFTVTNKSSMAEAERDVVRKCKRSSKSNANSCRAVFSYGNGCVAAVSGELLDGGFFLFPESAPTANEANRKAMSKCKKSAKDCEFIVQNECSIAQPPR